MFKAKRRRLLAIVFLAGLIVWLGSSAWVTWKFTRRSGSPFSEPPPEVAWAHVEGHRLETSDGQQLGAWFVRGDPQKGCVLLIHGIRSSRQQMLPAMQRLAEAHFTVLAISLRAHGDSTGEIYDFGWNARHDVAAAVEFLQKERPRLPIYIVGRSLGAATAIYAAGDLKGRVAGYFLEQPYKDIKSATWNRSQHHLPPVLDWMAYGGLRLWAPVFLPVAPDVLSPFDHIQDIPEGVPVVFVIGSADRDAHLDEVTAMYRRIESHAKLVVFDGARHENLDRADPGLYMKTLFNFLHRPYCTDRRRVEASQGLDRTSVPEPMENRCDRCRAGVPQRADKARHTQPLQRLCDRHRLSTP
jgi:alpha-beta hydrolase superfamily lysophospholipase